MNYLDIANLSEDERIEQIAQGVRLGKNIGFVTDSDAGKVDRYIQKLKAKIPDVVILSRGAGPIKGTVFVKVGPPKVSLN